MTTTEHIKTTRKTWVRTQAPEGGWGARGWLPILLMLPLLALGFFWMAPKRVEPQVEEQVKLRVAAMGWQPQKVEADGQNVDVWVQTTLDDKDPKLQALQAAVQTTNCKTWAGDLQCPAKVAIHPVAPPASAKAKSPASPAKVTTAPKARLHDFDFALKDGAITLRGEVESEAAKHNIELLARKHWPQSSIRNLLTVSQTPQTKDGALAADRGLAMLHLLQNGEAHWTKGELSVSGEVLERQKSLAHALFRQEKASPPLGTLNLKSVGLSAQQCNDELAELLESSSIHFRTASSTIHAQSHPLLDQIYALAQRCPGELEIEGHTDNIGRAESNLVLSKARAQAVRKALTQRGLDAKRLHAKGLGMTRPIASNNTKAGRAKNRRIEIRVQAPTTNSADSSDSTQKATAR